MNILMFLQGVFEQGHSFPTRKVYMAAISVGIDGATSGAHPLEVCFLKVVCRLRPVSYQPFVPIWDLCLVLNVLFEDPFEVMESVDLKILSYKTALLMTYDIRDLHALSVHSSCIKFALGDSKVTLRPNMIFTPKVMTMSYRSLAFETFPFLSPPPSEDQRRLHSLCPVQALRIYIEQTRGVCLCDQLFDCFANSACGRALF